MPRIKGVLFDMDGVLLDTERLGSQILPGIIESLGYTPPPDMYFRVLGANRQVSNEIYAGLFGVDFPGDLVDKLFFDRLMEIADRGETPLKPGLRQCIAALKSRGLKIALATSSERWVVENYQKHLPDMAGIFDAMVCGMEVPNGKPAPDIYRLAAQRIGLKAEECIGVEDSRNGLISLRNAGCYSVMIPDLLPFSDALAPYVDECAENLLQLPILADRLNGASGEM